MICLPRGLPLEPAIEHEGVGRWRCCLPSKLPLFQMEMVASRVPDMLPSSVCYMRRAQKQAEAAVPETTILSHMGALGLGHLLTGILAAMDGKCYRLGAGLADEKGFWRRRQSLHDLFAPWREGAYISYRPVRLRFTERSIHGPANSFGLRRQRPPGDLILLRLITSGYSGNDRPQGNEL